MVWRPSDRPRTEARARRQDGHSRGLTPDGPLRKLMSKAPYGLPSAAPISKIVRTDWTRQLWRTAYVMARRMIRDGERHGVGRRYTWYLNHARRRFGASGWRVAQAAGRLAFELRTVAYAAAGSVERLVGEHRTSGERKYYLSNLP